jgi:hypothetical protein
VAGVAFKIFDLVVNNLHVPEEVALTPEAGLADETLVRPLFLVYYFHVRL